MQAPAARTRSLVDGSNAPPKLTFITSKWMKKRAVAIAGYNHHPRSLKTARATIVVRR
jgi:hypothetical protein